MQRNIIINLILILLIVIFALQNNEAVTIQLYFWPITVSKGFLIILMLLIGIFLGILTATTGRRKKNKKEGIPESKEKPVEPESGDIKIHR